MERRAFFPALAGLGLFSASPQSVPGGDPLRPFYLPPNPEPLVAGPTGMSIRTWVRQSQTNGQFSSVEFAVGPKVMGPAPHVHAELDELMFVAEGTVSVLVGEEVYQVAAGGWHLRPRGLVHTFWNATDQPARAFDFYFQQPFEEYPEAVFHTFPREAQAKGLTMAAPEFQQKRRDLARHFKMESFPEKRAALVTAHGLN